jgi:signal transduction histidine kinase/CheY-like chemotaxis protein
MDDASPDPAALAERVEALSRENRKLHRICEALMDRAEQRLSHDRQFSFLEAGVVLGEEIAQRTAELHALNGRLLQQVAQREEAEAELNLAKIAAEEANLAKSRFVAAVGHDMLQPLTAARLFLGALPRGEPGLVERIARCLESAEAMLESIQEYSRVEAGALSPAMADFAIGDLLARLQAEFQMRCEDRGLVLRVARSSLRVHSDPNLLERILRNLLGNAVRYTRRGGVLAGCRRAGDAVRIMVVDTGPGIPEDRQQEIFDEFVQLRAERGAAEKGLGLGLAIARAMARVIGAELELCSIPGKGSAFSVTVARGAAAAPVIAAPAGEPEGALPLEGKRILIIDDDEAVLEALALTVEGWGCGSLIAVSHATALEAVEQGALLPDLIIADYHLGEDRGTAVVGRLRTLYDRTIPAIIVTSDRSAGLPDELRRQGWTVLPKPFDPARLRETAQRLIAPAEG